MEMTLSLTHRCNLACRYCYAAKTEKPDMSLDTAIAALDWGISMTPEGEQLDIGFFGGEPLLCTELISDICDYLRIAKRHHNRRIELSITTNGTLLDKAALAFLSKENIAVCVSIDGPKEVHDAFRQNAEGKGSFDTVFENLKLACWWLDQVQVNAVYTPETIQKLPGTLRFLADLGVTGIHFNPDINARWTPSHLPLFSEVFEELAEVYMEYFRKGKKIAVNTIDGKALLFLKKGYSKQFRYFSAGRVDQ